MAVLAARSAHTEANASTWVFLGVLALLTAGILIGWVRVVRRWQPPATRDDLVTAARFYALHGHHDELDLGRNWRSTDDPGAIWRVWWVPDTRQLIGLRLCDTPPPVGIRGSGHLYRWSWGYNPAAGIGGMKILGTAPSPDRHVTDHLRLRPDGLDRLCGGTGSRGHVLAR